MKKKFFMILAICLVLVSITTVSLYSMIPAFVNDLIYCGTTCVYMWPYNPEYREPCVYECMGY